MGNFINFSTSADIQKLIDNITASGASIEEQKQAISKLFTQTTEQGDTFIVSENNNVNSSNKARMQANAEILQEKLEEYEKKLEEIEKQIEPLDEQLNEKTQEVSDYISDISTTANDWEKEQKALIDKVVSDYVASYKKGKITEGQFRTNLPNAIAEQLTNFPNNALEKLFDELSDANSELSVLVGSISSLISERNIYVQKYDSTKSAHDIVASVASKVGSTSTTYTNSDYDTNVPTYSPAKVAAIADIAEQYQVNSGINSEDKKNIVYTYADKLNSLQNLKNTDGTPKYSGIFNGTDGKNAGGDSTVIGAPANQLLQQSINNGLLTDLDNVGLTASEKAQFFATYFSGSGFTYNETTNAFSAHYGHDTTASALFRNVVNNINNTTTNSSINPNNTWNTISNNAQVKKLAENYETIMNQLTNSGLTFKESMYALFNEDNGIFKDTGIVYNLDEQSSNGASYSIIPAGDEETRKFYQTFTSYIEKQYSTTNVNKVNVTEAETANGEKVEVKEETPVAVKRTDPISFEKNGIQYSFVIDRNNDGKLNSTDELVGAQDSSGKTWLDDLKSFDKNGDGYLTGTELENVRLAGTKFTDETGNALNDGANTVNIDYSIVDAASLGIESINLNGLTAGNTTGKTDANNAEVFNDGFIINYSDGTTSQVTRKDDTTSYLNTVFGSATSSNKNMNVNLTEDELNDILDNAYSTTANNKITDENKFEYYYTDLQTSTESLKDATEEYDVLREEMDATQERVNRYSISKQAEAKAANLPGDESYAATTSDEVNEKRERDKQITQIKAEAMKEGIHLNVSEAFEWATNGQTFAENLAEYMQKHRDNNTQNNEQTNQ